ncbi:gamma-glutamyl-gamma-aminobutyrate hydrolase family protein [Microvirga flavescens]|uniref:gamma-glutamyl-gamma-aminobutyrate hydrolase family protein n=1 Tax=Microvirga flavescens TaxID=2249811 RepID=UPI000DD5310F|nr:gamma-glutamyl-gamma-aminobutyrate hydrolase family protein [Microvirga flavescens]
MRHNTSAARPLLGIVACNRRVGDEIAASVMHRYLIGASRYMDASLIIVPSLPDAIDAPRIAAAVDGILLTGSPSNIASHRYGDGAAGGEGPFDEARDETVERLLDAVVDAQKPVFGICRGLQEINVALGGTLRRDLGEKHHAPSDASFVGMFEHRHSVALSEGGLLARALGDTVATVNSVHYQGIDKLASSLTVEATAPDGVVEAVSGSLGASRIIAVQWHPEWKAEADPQSQAIFQLFGRTLRGVTEIPTSP